MSDKEELAGYYRESASWSNDRVEELSSSRRIAWIVAGVAAFIALLEGIALVALTPLKTVVPYTLLVDRQTGYVQAINPLDKETVAPDAALVRSFLVQYVTAREGFDSDSIAANYRKVALWSADAARSRYIASMQPSNPASPAASLPRRALVEVQLRSISSLGPDSSLVRFSTTRTDPGGQPRPPELWAAVIKYRFSAASMTADDRLLNPLGFQVVRYRRDAEILPEPSEAPARLPDARNEGRPANPQPAQISK